MSIIISFILLFIIIRSIFRVMWYGRGIIKPDFERVDMYYDRKKNITTNWNTPFGRSVYYTFPVIFLLVLVLVFIHWYLFNWLFVPLRYPGGLFFLSHQWHTSYFCSKDLKDYPDCHSQPHIHTTIRNHWKIVTDSSLRGNLTFELVSPLLKGEQSIEELKTRWNRKPTN